MVQLRTGADWEPRGLQHVTKRPQLVTRPRWTGPAASESAASIREGLQAPCLSQTSARKLAQLGQAGHQRETPDPLVFTRPPPGPWSMQVQRTRLGKGYSAGLVRHMRATAVMPKKKLASIMSVHALVSQGVPRSGLYSSTCGTGCTGRCWRAAASAGCAGPPPVPVQD